MQNDDALIRLIPMSWVDWPIVPLSLTWTAYRLSLRRRDGDLPILKPYLKGFGFDI
jgi:hypothetical protein